MCKTLQVSASGFYGWLNRPMCRRQKGGDRFLMGVRPSMGTVGDADDNAMAESFFASLECELIARRPWKTEIEARLTVFTWIESWYNPRRCHSGLNCQSANNFEKKHQEDANNTETQIVPALQ
jgi:putative transposase